MHFANADGILVGDRQKLYLPAELRNWFVLLFMLAEGRTAKNIGFAVNRYFHIFRLPLSSSLPDVFWHRSVPFPQLLTQGICSLQVLHRVLSYFVCSKSIL